MPASALNTETLTEVAHDHTSRLRDVERALTQLITNIQPAIGKVEAQLEALDSKVDSLCSDVKELKDAGGDARVEDVKREARLDKLEEDLQERKLARGAAMKWAAGVVATVVGAATIAWFGFSSKPTPRRDYERFDRGGYAAPAASK